MLYIINVDTRWTKPEFGAAADFIPRKSALFSHTVSKSWAFIDVTESRNIL
jgi:hypothetical protein